MNCLHHAANIFISLKHGFWQILRSLDESNRVPMSLSCYRRSRCFSCADRKTFIFDRCKHCGCLICFKVILTDEECPLERWNDYPFFSKYIWPILGNDDK